MFWTSWKNKVVMYRNALKAAQVKNMHGHAEEEKRDVPLDGVRDQGWPLPLGLALHPEREGGQEQQGEDQQHYVLWFREMFL